MVRRLAAWDLFPSRSAGYDLCIVEFVSFRFSLVWSVLSQASKQLSKLRNLMIGEQTFPGVQIIFSVESVTVVFI